jgi:hypothetical protein
MLHVVADADVLISAALPRSPQAPSAFRLDAALDRPRSTAASSSSPRHCWLQEVTIVLGRPPAEIPLRSGGAPVPHRPGRPDDPTRRSPAPHPAVCRDPHDDYLVALATASGAGEIVSGDLDLLAIDPSQLAIEIMPPRQLVDRLS